MADEKKQQKMRLPDSRLGGGAQTPTVRDPFELNVMDPLRRLSRRIRSYLLVRGLARVTVVIGICILAQLSVDWIFRLRVDLRAAVLVCVMMVVGWSIWKHMVRSVMIRLDPDDIASALERKFPALQSGLVSAVQFFLGKVGPSGSNSRLLMTRTRVRAESIVEAVQFDALLNHGRARRHMSILCVTLSAVVLAFWMFPDTMGTWLERNVFLRDIPWKQYTFLSLVNDADRDGQLFVARGDDLAIKVRAAGRTPREAQLNIGSGSEQSRQYTMTAVGSDEFQFVVSHVQNAFRFAVTGGDARIGEFSVSVVDRPRVQQWQVQITPPKYMGQSPYRLDVEGQTSVSVPVGAHIQLEVTTNKPVLEASLMRDHQEVVRLDPGNSQSLQVQFEPEQDGFYWLALKDALGLDNRTPRQLRIGRIDDSPPSVVLTVHKAGDLITPRAVLPVSLEFKDEHGLASGAMVYQLGHQDSPEVGIRLQEVVTGMKQIEVSRTLNVRELGAMEGDGLLLWGKAEDLNDVNGPGVGTSPRYRFRVVAEEEFFAELARREQEFRREFESAVTTQESIRTELLSIAVNALVDEEAALKQLAVLERLQFQVSKQVQLVSDQFNRIFNELTVNQLVSQESERRILHHIVRPLEQLSENALGESISLFEKLRVNARNREDQNIHATMALLDRNQVRVLDELRRVLDQMIRWEGYHETVNLLQAMIKMQTQVKEETEKTVDQELEDLLGK